MENKYQGYRHGFTAKYSGPTNHKGASYNCRFIRFNETTRFRVNYDHGKGFNGTMAQAVEKFEQLLNADPEQDYKVVVKSWFLSESSETEYFVSVDTELRF